MKVILSLFFMFSILGIQAQRVLIVDKLGKPKRLRYYTGDVIWTITSDGQKQEGVITALTDTSFAIRGSEVMLRDVKYVVRKRKFYNYSSKLVTIGTLFYTSIVAVNSLISDEEEVNRAVILKSASGLALSRFLWMFRKKKYKVKKSHRIRILNLTMEAPNEND